MPILRIPLHLPSDIVIYFDDIIVNNDPAPSSGAVDVIEDYEIIPLNVMLGRSGRFEYNDLDNGNPDPAGINTSTWVVQFLRDKDGVPWGGFWSPTGVDVTTNHYMHVKVWKPRISPP